MFNTRTNASTSSPTGLMMATDPTMFYSSFPPTSCDFNVRSTIVSVRFSFLSIYFYLIEGKYNVFSITISSTTSKSRRWIYEKYANAEFDQSSSESVSSRI